MADDAPTVGQAPAGTPLGQAFDDGGMAFGGGAAQDNGTPETAFPVPSWGQRLEENRPVSEDADPKAVVKPRNRGMDTGWKNIPRWQTPIKDRYT